MDQITETYQKIDIFAEKIVQPSPRNARCCRFTSDRDGRSCKNRRSEPPKQFTTRHRVWIDKSIKINRFTILRRGAANNKRFRISFFFRFVWLFVLISFLDLSWWHGWRWLQSFSIGNIDFLIFASRRNIPESEFTRYHERLLNKHS